MTQLDLTMDIRMRELDIESAELRAYITANTDLPSRYADEFYVRYGYNERLLTYSKGCIGKALSCKVLM